MNFIVFDWTITSLVLVTSIICPVTPTSCGFARKPVNSTVCLGSSAQFVCAVKSGDAQNIFYLVNSRSTSEVANQGVIISALVLIGDLTYVNLTLPGSIINNNSLITCKAILPNGTVLESSAYLSVQGPPGAPNNILSTPINSSSIMLTWGAPSDVQMPSVLLYAVTIRNGSGGILFNKTLSDTQLIFNAPNSCDQYKASVTALCETANGSNVQFYLKGTPPTQFQQGHIISKISYSSTLQENVTFSIWQPESCSYDLIASSGEMVFPPFSVDVSQSRGTRINITITLPSNKYFNVTLTAYNAYGNTTTTLFISTFELYDIDVNSSDVVCKFYPGSLTRGCLVYITDIATKMVYCKVVPRSADIEVNRSLCTFEFSAPGLLNAGVYSIMAYDIKSDGTMPQVPAISGAIVTIIGSIQSTGSSTSVMLLPTSTMPSTTSSDHLQRQLLLPVVITISFLLIGAMITTAAIIMWTTRTKWNRRREATISNVSKQGSINKERLNTADSIDLEMCPAYSQTKITVSIDLEMCPAYSQTKNSKMGVNSTFDQNYRI